VGTCLAHRPQSSLGSAAAAGRQGRETSKVTADLKLTSGFFQDRDSWTICLGRLWTMILLIFASWVARIIGMNTSTQLKLYFWSVDWAVCLRQHFWYETQTSLEFTILLPRAPECWDYRSAPPCLICLFFTLSFLFLIYCIFSIILNSF
jgi:hypothetical protein